jgi:hypothetical protein
MSLLQRHTLQLPETAVYTHGVFMSKQRTFSKNNVNWLVFVIQTQCSLSCMFSIFKYFAVECRRLAACAAALTLCPYTQTISGTVFGVSCQTPCRAPSWYIIWNKYGRGNCGFKNSHFVFSIMFYHFHIFKINTWHRALLFIFRSITCNIEERYDSLIS